jgi:hypothetical protein
MYVKNNLLAVAVLLGLNTLNAEASLTAETSNGVQVVYDNVNNITWTADANLLGTLENTYGTSTIVNAILQANYSSTLNASVVHDTSNSLDNDGSGVYKLSSADFNGAATGTVDYWGAQAFVVYLNSIDYAGSNQWALPATSPNTAEGFGFNQTGSQLGDLFYNELGGSVFSPITTTNNGNASLFSNLLAADYWSGTQWAQSAADAWYFYNGTGIQNYAAKNTQFYALEVSPGNNVASSVPVPSAVWLFGSGLGLLAIKNRRKIPA